MESDQNLVGRAAISAANALLKSGRFEAFWEFGLKSWDTAAGMLIATEAGGKVTDLAGGTYQPGGPSILVTNGLVHDEVQRVAAEIAARPAKF